MSLSKFRCGVIAVLVLTATVPDIASAADDPIAKEAERCLASPQGQTTAGMEACSAAAYQAYDQQMNDIYANVMGRVDPKSQFLIRASQRAWIAYRDAKAPLTALPGKPIGVQWLGLNWRRSELMLSRPESKSFAIMRHSRPFLDGVVATAGIGR